jgi:hypothetical protein
MPKARRTVTVVLPGYEHNRGQWRRKIHGAALRAAEKAGVTYDRDDAFEVIVLLYLKKGKRLSMHDVDNRLKDILDALQGRFGRSKSSRSLIEDDRHVCRVLIEKQKIPKLYGGKNVGGRLKIRPYRRHHWREFLATRKRKAAR